MLRSGIFLFVFGFISLTQQKLTNLVKLPLSAKLHAGKLFKNYLQKKKITFPTHLYRETCCREANVYFKADLYHIVRSVSQKNKNKIKILFLNLSQRLKDGSAVNSTCCSQ